MNILEKEEGSRQILCFHVTYTKLMILAKVIQIIAALALLAEVAVRFVYFLQLGSLSNYILTFYFIFLGFYLIGFELGIKRLKLKFYLMNFAWGKAVMDFFIGTLVASAQVIPALDYIILIIFLTNAFILVVISCMYRKEEKERVDAELSKLEEYRE